MTNGPRCTTTPSCPSSHGFCAPRTAVDTPARAGHVGAVGGKDDFIRANWDAVRAGGISYKWTLSGDLSQPIKGLIEILVAGGVILASVLQSDGHTSYKQCGDPDRPDGRRTVIIYDDREEEPECPPY